MNEQTPYRTLFVGQLVQESSLSVGGRDLPSIVDSPWCRDGLNRLTLRGTGIAGALIATLRKLDGRVPDTISGLHHLGDDPPGAKHLRSRWRVFNSHPKQSPETEFRQHVAIDAQTGAATDDHLFSVETLPKGSRWPLLIEVDTSLEDGVEAERLAARALREWEAGRCWLGRDVARGLGWMRLDGLRVFRLYARDHQHLWPNATESDDYWQYIDREIAAHCPPTSPTELTAIDADEDPASGWQYYELVGHCRVGERPDGFGLDSLSLGGHAADTLLATWDAQHFLAPEGRSAQEHLKAFDPDSALAFTAADSGARVPYLPGSSIRGVLRHAIARLFRAQGKDKDLRRVEAVFGTPRRSGALLVSDGFLTGAWKAAWLQHHAADEFAGGVYGPAKYDRMALISGEFRFRLTLEAPDAETLRQYREGVIKPLLELARSGRIALGGSVWRGHGWVQWEFSEISNPARSAAK